MMPRKKVIMLCTHHLDSPFKVGSHYFREYFISQNYDVLYLSAPITPFHILKLKESDVRERIRKCFKSTQSSNDGELIPASLLAPDSNYFLNSNFVIKNWHYFSSDILKKIKRQNFLNPELLYIDNIFYSFLLAKLSPEKTIFRVMDKHIAFPGWGKNIFNLAQNITEKSDLVVYSAKNLLSYVDELGASKSKYIPNGLDLKLYERILPAPSLYQELSGPIAVYVGSLDKWFNYEWVLSAAKKLPKVSFVIIGPSEFNGIKFKEQKNIYYLGAIKNKQVVPFLQWADVGLIPFNTNEFEDLIKTINPIKLYEYEAAGLPVISSKWESSELHNSKATLVENYVEFERALTLISKSKKEKSLDIKNYDWSNILKLNLQPFLDD